METILPPHVHKASKPAASDHYKDMSEAEVVQTFKLAVLHLFICLFSHFSFSSSFKEKPPDMCEEESHLCFCHGIYHQRHAHRSQSDAEERHGVAAPTVSGKQASLHVHASG